MSSDPPVVIELFGQPGVGKSTLVRTAVTDSMLQTTAQLGAAWRRQSVATKGRIAGAAILDVTGPAHAARLAIDGRLGRADSLSRLFRLLIKSRWLRSRSGRLLLEEGHLQELWSIFYSAGKTEPDPQLLAPLIACLYRGLDAQILFLDAGPDELFHRIRNRAHGKSRLDRLTEPELRRHLAATAQLPRRIAEAARMAGLIVERIDASAPIERMADQLRGVVRRRDMPPET